MGTSLAKDPFRFGADTVSAPGDCSTPGSPWALIDRVPEAKIRRYSLMKLMNCSVRPGAPDEPVWAVMAGGSGKFKPPLPRVLELLADAEVMALLPVTRLYLVNRSTLGPEALTALEASPRWAHLFELDASFSPKLVSAPPPLAGVGQLRRLIVARCKLTAARLAALLEGDAPALTTLALGGNPLGASGAAVLAERAPRTLEALSLESTDLDDEAAAALLGGRPFPALTCLDLVGNGLTAAGYERLLASEAFPALLELRASGYRVAPGDLARLSSVRPGVEVVG